MKILITGCKGQLGSELCRCFESGRTELGVPDVLKLSNEITAVDIEDMDISEQSAVSEFFSDKKFDVIINCAAYSNVDGCEKEVETAFRVNALGTRNLAVCAEKQGAKLIHISSDYLFNGKQVTPYREWDEPDPLNIYGKSKLLGEQYAEQFCSRYFLVRTAWLYGYSGKNFVKTMLKINKENGGCKVVSDQVGNPTNAADLAHHILKLMTTEEYGIYHGTCGGECSWYDLAKKIVELADIKADITPCKTGEYRTAAVRPAYSALDNMMFRCTVGDEFRDWETALECFFKNFNRI